MGLPGSIPKIDPTTRRCPPDNEPFSPKEGSIAPRPRFCLKPKVSRKRAPRATVTARPRPNPRSYRAAAVAPRVGPGCVPIQKRSTDRPDSVHDKVGNTSPQAGWPARPVQADLGIEFKKSRTAQPPSTNGYRRLREAPGDREELGDPCGAQHEVSSPVVPNEATPDAVRMVARTEGMVIDPVKEKGASAVTAGPTDPAKRGGVPRVLSVPRAHPGVRPALKRYGVLFSEPCGAYRPAAGVSLARCNRAFLRTCLTKSSLASKMRATRCQKKP